MITLKRRAGQFFPRVLYGLRAARLNQQRIIVTGGHDGATRDEVLKCQCDILYVDRCLSTMLKHQLGRKSGILKGGDLGTPLLKLVALVISIQ